MASDLNNTSGQNRSGKSVSMRQSIEIKAAPEKIFDFISDLSNDVKWRPEVERMEASGSPKVGVQVIEYLRIYRYLKFVTPAVIRVMNRPQQFVVETPESHPSWVHCIRTVEQLDATTCLFTVQLSFSLDNLLQISPFIPPGFLVRAWYVPRIRHYLRKLKVLLELKETSL